MKNYNCIRVENQVTDAKLYITMKLELAFDWVKLFFMKLETKVVKLKTALH